MNSTNPQELASFPAQTILKTIRFSSKESFESLKKRILSYFLATYEQYEKLFTIIKRDRSFYTKPEPLRHPLIFYYGHTSCVYVNKLLDRGIINERVNPSYQRMFAVGVDQMDWDDLNQTHYDWPSVKDTLKYRQQVKSMIVDVINKLQEERVSWTSKLWVIMMGIEHERIHLETSAVIMRRLPIDQIQPNAELLECPYTQCDISLIPQNKLVKVQPFSGKWDRQRQSAITYGWDNEFGIHHIETAQFKAGSMLVSNGQFWQFFADNGYQKMEYWTEQGKRWLESTKKSHPIFWISSKQTQNQPKPQNFKLRTMQKIIEMPWNWPAELNNLQARAFCQWKSKKQGKYYRLPTEDEYYSMRFQSMGKLDQYDWEPKSVGNINLEYWLSPSPVDLFTSKTGTLQLYDIVGNVWQHTITPIYSFAEFQVHPTYQDFTTPTFDMRHDLLKGGSFISTGNQALLHARYAFRRHFYQFAGIRYVQGAPKIQVDVKGGEGVGDKQVEEILWKMYGQQTGYYLDSVKIVREWIKQPDLLGKGLKLDKIVTMGCSVGRIPLEFGKDFKESIGLDYTARYFQMSTRLKESSILKMPNFVINLATLSLSPHNVNFLQMHPQNPDQKKLNECTFLFIDASFLRAKRLNIVLKKAMALMIQGPWMLAIVCDELKNDISDEQVQEIVGNIEKIGEKNIGEGKSIKGYMKI